jgi:hypothetical protein
MVKHSDLQLFNSTTATMPVLKLKLELKISKDCCYLGSAKKNTIVLHRIRYQIFTETMLRQLFINLWLTIQKIK